jgi:MFS transporter, SHS family, sialic acid transporter
MNDDRAGPTAPPTMTDTGRYVILAAAFLGWAFSGMQMSLTGLVARSAAIDFVRQGRLSPEAPLSWDGLLASDRPAGPVSAEGQNEILKRIAPRWTAWYNSAFLLGAAFGGFVFGSFGDRAGRVKAMGLSIVWYSLFAGLGYVGATPEQLLALRFLSAMGVGGMWPSGVSLASEAWSDVSRPMLSGLIGTAANVGIVLMGVVGMVEDITPDAWRWTMLVGGAPLVLGLAVWAVVPESPSWLAARQHQQSTGSRTSALTVFRPPLLKLTMLGIALGAIPLLGGWGVTQWFIFWSDKVMGSVDPQAKALTTIMRAGGGAIGSLLGGWIANLCGRRLSYFMISLVTLGLAEYAYFNLAPGDAYFQPFVFAIGFVSTIYFGWLPLYLPELFPTHARATGSGVSFNFGRILTAAGVLGTGALTSFYREDYAAAGRITSLVYALGMIVILFAPDTTGKKLKEE